MRKKKKFMIVFQLWSNPRPEAGEFTHLATMNIYHFSYKKAMHYGITCSHVYDDYMMQLHSLVINWERLEAMARWFTLFRVAFSLLTAFSISLEGSVIKVKPAAPVPVDTSVSLKA